MISEREFNLRYYIGQKRHYNGWYKPIHDKLNNQLICQVLAGIVRLKMKLYGEALG